MFWRTLVTERLFWQIFQLYFESRPMLDSCNLLFYLVQYLFLLFQREILPALILYFLYIFKIVCYTFRHFQICNKLCTFITRLQRLNVLQ